jgi:glycosyltransferase involved in cell wall biosynthesis
MNREQFDCHVISLTSKGNIGPKISELGIPVILCGMKNGLPDPIGFFRLFRTLQKLKPDIVQTWLYHADLLAGLAAKFAGVKKIFWNIRQSNLDTDLNKWHARLTARCCAFLSYWLPDKIICNSQTAIKVHQKLGYKRSLFHLIGNGFDLEKFCINPFAKSVICRQLMIPEKSPLIGLIARFDPQKDHRNFILAANRVLESLPDAQFVLVGSKIDDDNKFLLDWIEQTGHKENFHLLGEREDISQINSALDVACSASLGEGFPNTIGEAMACGVPCVVTDVGDSAYLVGDAGLVVPSANSQALAQAIIELLDKPERNRHKLGKKARQRIEEYFSISAIVAEYEKIYQI